jgi:tRNA A37 N6-isopentenylltransferase MiaA
LHGPLGTGKTYTANRLAKLISCNACNDENLSFHELLDIVNGKNNENGFSGFQRVSLGSLNLNP